MTVLVAGRHHGQMPVNGPDAVVCQEVLFDKAQGVIRSIVQSTLTKGTKKKNRKALLHNDSFKNMKNNNNWH